MQEVMFLIYISFLALFFIVMQGTGIIYEAVKKSERDRKVGEPSYENLAKILHHSAIGMMGSYGVAGLLFILF